MGEKATGLTIGEAARLAGVSTRAVRHYHAIGLLAEPERSVSGYRHYRSENVIALVRVARLRALGMPIPQIKSRLASDDDDVTESLRALAEDLDSEIRRLTETRDRLRRLADSGEFDRPAHSLAQALRDHGLLPDEAELSRTESTAAGLVDALHPGGIVGAIDHAQTILTDSTTRERLSALMQRFTSLSADAAGPEVEQLAEELVAAVPRPENAPPPIDLATMDRLVGDRLNSAQRQVMHLFRRLVLTP